MQISVIGAKSYNEACQGYPKFSYRLVNDNGATIVLDSMLRKKKIYLNNVRCVAATVYSALSILVKRGWMTSQGRILKIAGKDFSQSFVLSKDDQGVKVSRNAGISNLQFFYSENSIYSRQMAKLYDSGEVTLKFNVTDAIDLKIYKENRKFDLVIE